MKCPEALPVMFKDRVTPDYTCNALFFFLTMLSKSNQKKVVIAKMKDLLQTEC